MLKQEVLERVETSSFLDDLLECIDNEEVKSLGIDEETEKNSITNRSQAEYFIKLYKKLDAENDEIKETAKSYIESTVDKVNKWQEAEIGRNERTMTYIKNMLEIYAAKELEESNSKRKSIKFIEGTLAFRQPQDKYEYDDDVLRNNISKKYLIPQEPKVNHKDLKKDGVVRNGKLYIDNVLVEGVTVTPQEKTFKIN